jgi:alginate O-acetyltransferase complex protein AlgI
MHFVSIAWLLWMSATVSAHWLVPPGRRRFVVALATVLFLLVHAPRSAAYLGAFISLTYVSTRRQPVTGYRVAVAGFAMVVVLAFFKVTTRSNPEELLREALIPLGLSYYTFRCIHYLFERYRGSFPEHGIGDFLCYILFIPTIVVGPIHRFDAFLRDLREHRWDAGMLSAGMERILYGYVKIAVLGNYLLSIRMAHWIGSLDPTQIALRNYLEIVRGGLNLYMQFSGFSDVAIGFASILGYRVMENFNWPYLQRNIGDLWRSWHMSLTSWCRDYVYLPILGLTRNPYLATVGTFLVIGLWHEVSPRYLVWAMYNASWVLAWQSLQRAKRKARIPPVENAFARACLNGVNRVLAVHVFWFGLAIVRQPDLLSALKVFRVVLFFWI